MSGGVLTKWLIEDCVPEKHLRHDPAHESRERSLLVIFAESRPDMLNTTTRAVTVVSTFDAPNKTLGRWVNGMNTRSARQWLTE